jgi:hypothetical protein
VVSSNEVPEWARDLKRGEQGFSVLDESAIDQTLDLVFVAHGCIRGNDTPHAVPVEGRRLQPALVSEVDEGVVEPDVTDHAFSPLSLLPKGRAMLKGWLALSNDGGHVTTIVKPGRGFTDPRRALSWARVGEQESSSAPPPCTHLAGLRTPDIGLRIILAESA